MKVGDKVVCVNASPGFIDGVTGLVKGEIYTVLEIHNWFNPFGIVVAHGDKSWQSTRFRPVDDTFGEQETEKVLEHFKLEREWEEGRTVKPKKERV